MRSLYDTWIFTVYQGYCYLVLRSRTLRNYGRFCQTLHTKTQSISIIMDFDNRIRELNQWKATDELTEVTFDMGHEAALTWNLPASYVCIVRAVKSNGKIQERAYRQAKAAKTYMKSLLMNDHDYVVMTSNAVLDTQSDIP